MLSRLDVEYGQLTEENRALQEKLNEISHRAEVIRAEQSRLAIELRSAQETAARREARLVASQSAQPALIAEAEQLQARIAELEALIDSYIVTNGALRTRLALISS